MENFLSVVILEFFCGLGHLLFVLSPIFGVIFSLHPKSVPSPLPQNTPKVAYKDATFLPFLY
jgi:hypothetical protein